MNYLIEVNGRNIRRVQKEKSTREQRLGTMQIFVDGRTL